KIATPTPVVAMPSLEKNAAGYVGVKFFLPEGWHIYWANSGDSGMPTELTLTTDAAVSIAPIHWPAPERIREGEFTTYGYKNTVTLLRPITARETLTSATIEIAASWLICKEICIPESAKFTVALPGNDAVEEALTQVPTPVNWPASYRADEEEVTLAITLPESLKAAEASWFPLNDGVIRNSAAQRAEQAGNQLTLTVERGLQSLPEKYEGVLLAGGRAYHIAAQQDNAAAHQDTGFLLILGLALLGGLILNLMPCVLPVLSLKALGLAKKGASERRAVVLGGLAYTAGVLLSFAIIATLLIILRGAGEGVGWGFQLQSPLFVGALSLLMLAISLNLAGFFELPILFGGLAGRLHTRHPHLESFLTGILAVALAAPCTAPFMATAVGAAATLPVAEAMLVFLTLGFGLALPYLLICLIPAARRLLPKPGAWMIRFRKILAIPMFATFLWLTWVLLQLMGGTEPAASAKNYDMGMVKVVAYDATKLAELRAEGTPVLLDATAAWCITCKVNERVAIKREATQKFLVEHGVVLMVADWTERNAEITRLLGSFGRDGVPMVVFYPPFGEPIILPQILTIDIILDTLAPYFKAIG
ncbi:MAG: protein-disulfide reductase DsbD family protein, partial [Alphaproteobacteria bacterium]